MHRRQISSNLSEVQLTTQKEEKNGKKFKIVLAENQIWRKQLKSQETTGKTSKKQN